MLKKILIAALLLVAVLDGVAALLNTGKQPILDRIQVTVDSAGHHPEGVMAALVAHQFLSKAFKG